MKNPAQIIILILLLSGGFWVGIQWGESSREKALQERIDALAAEVPTKPVEITVQPTQSSNLTPTPTEVVTTVATETTEPEVVKPSAPVNISKPLNPDEKVTKYENKSYGYSFDVPASVYYSSFGPENGAIQTFGVKKEALPETLTDSTTRVYYYGKKVLPELKNAENNMYQDPEGTYIAILVNGTHSFKIESSDLESSTVLRILQTISVGQ